MSQLLHLSAGRLIASIREIIAAVKLKRLKPPSQFKVNNTLPAYVNQFANSSKIGSLKFSSKIHDLRAAHCFGTTNLAKFSYWSWRACGIAALQMVLQTRFQDKFRQTTMQLIHQGRQLGGYNTITDSGWYHRSLIQLAQKYSLRAVAHKFIPTSTIALKILKHHHIIASIKSPTGGHLILIYGARFNQKGQLQGFLIHNPSHYQKPGRSQFISKKQFEKLSTRRIIEFPTN